MGVDDVVDVHWRTILQALGVADPAVGVDDVVDVHWRTILQALGVADPAVGVDDVVDVHWRTILQALGVADPVVGLDDVVDVHWRTILQALGVADPVVGVDDVVDVQSDGDIHRTLLGRSLPDVAQDESHEHEDECRGRPRLDDRSPVCRVLRRPKHDSGSRQVYGVLRLAVPSRSSGGRIYADVLQSYDANLYSLVLLHSIVPHSAQAHDHHTP